MKSLDEWRDSPCGCRAQKSLYRDSIGTPHTAWVTRSQCATHKAESEEIARWFAEGGHLKDDDDEG